MLCIASTAHAYTSWLVAVLTLLLALQIVYAWQQVNRRYKLSFDNDLWDVRSHGSMECTSSRLLRASYTSSWLIVLVFATDSGQRFVLPIWRGSVSAKTFSLLHYAAAYRTGSTP